MSPLVEAMRETVKNDHISYLGHENAFDLRQFVAREINNNNELVLSSIDDMYNRSRVGMINFMDEFFVDGAVEHSFDITAQWEHFAESGYFSTVQFWQYYKLPTMHFTDQYLIAALCVLDQWQYQITMSKDEATIQFEKVVNGVLETRYHTEGEGYSAELYNVIIMQFGNDFRFSTFRFLHDYIDRNRFELDRFGQTINDWPSVDSITTINRKIHDMIY